LKKTIVLVRKDTDANEHCKGIVLREVLFTSVDKHYIWASLSFWCFFGV